jgi:hypothetical protein
MAAGAKTLDLILDTIGAQHDYNAEGGLLATDGKLVLIGLVPAPMSYAVPNFLFSRHTVTGSLIGGMKRTQGASTRILAWVVCVCAREIREDERERQPAWVCTRSRGCTRGACVGEGEIMNPPKFYHFSKNLPVWRGRAVSV